MPTLFNKQYLKGKFRQRTSGTDILLKDVKSGESFFKKNRGLKTNAMCLFSSQLIDYTIVGL